MTAKSIALWQELFIGKVYDGVGIIFCSNCRKNILQNFQEKLKKLKIDSKFRHEQRKFNAINYLSFCNSKLLNFL